MKGDYYYDRVTEIIGPYLEKAAKSEHGGPPLNFMQDMVNLHAVLLDMAGQADRDNSALVELYRRKQELNDEMRKLVEKLTERRV